MSAHSLWINGVLSLSMPRTRSPSAFEDQFSANPNTHSLIVADSQHLYFRPAYQVPSCLQFEN